MRWAAFILNDEFRAFQGRVRQVVAVVLDGFLLLDLAGPLGALEVAGNYVSDPYAINLISVSGGVVRSSSGVGVETMSFRRQHQSTCHSFLWGPDRKGRRFCRTRCAHPRDEFKRPPLCPHMLRRISACRCWPSGRAACNNHWGEAQLFRRDYPGTAVDAECLFVEDGTIWTSAGITAGIDLALALIESDHGFLLNKGSRKASLFITGGEGGSNNFRHASTARPGWPIWNTARMGTRTAARAHGCKPPRRTMLPQSAPVFPRFRTGDWPAPCESDRENERRLRIFRRYCWERKSGNYRLKMRYRDHCRMRRSFIRIRGFSP